MKPILYLIFIILLLLLSCKKENEIKNNDDNIIVGGLYCDYAYSEKYNSTYIIINDSLFTYNKIFAGYYSHQPTSNNNILSIYLYDTTVRNNHLHIEIYTDYIKPDSFFKVDSFFINKIEIGRNGISQYFNNINAYFYWDTVSYSNHSFSGKARLKIPSKLVDQNHLETFYSVQEMKFEF